MKIIFLSLILSISTSFAIEQQELAIFMKNHFRETALGVYDYKAEINQLSYDAHLPYDPSFIKPSYLPQGLATKIISGLKTLHDNGLVLVGDASNFEVDGHWYRGRSGVMTKEESERIYKQGVRGAQFGATQSHVSQKDRIFIRKEYKLMLEYLNFQFRYDEEKMEWVPKYEESSSEKFVVNTTMDFIRTTQLMNQDSYYDFKIYDGIEKSMPEIVSAPRDSLSLYKKTQRVIRESLEKAVREY